MSRFLDARRFHAEKLCWQHQVLADPELNAFAKTLGAFLMHYLDDVQGGGWTSQPFLAERLKVDVRTIRRAFVDLEKHGHLALETSRGRGRANIYRPLLKTGTGPTPPASPSEPSQPSGLDPANTVNERTPSSSNAEDGTSMSETATERRTAETEKADSRATPTLIEPYSPPPPKPADRERAGSVEPPARPRSRRTRKPSGQKPAPRIITLPAFPEAAVRAAVVNWIGDAGARSYLDPSGWRPSDRTVVCRLRFAADMLRQRVGPQLARLGVSICHLTPTDQGVLHAA